MKAVLSYIQALRASASYGAALKHRRKGDVEKCIESTKNGLDFLSRPFVIRTNPAESSALIHLTMLFEQIAHETNTHGANIRDLQDTYEIIKDNVKNNISNEYKEWLPYLAKKLGYKPKA